MFVGFSISLMNSLCARSVLPPRHKRIILLGVIWEECSVCLRRLERLLSLRPSFCLSGTHNSRPARSLAVDFLKAFVLYLISNRETRPGFHGLTRKISEHHDIHLDPAPPTLDRNPSWPSQAGMRGLKEAMTSSAATQQNLPNTSELVSVTMNDMCGKFWRIKESRK